MNNKFYLLVPILLFAPHMDAMAMAYCEEYGNKCLKQTAAYEQGQTRDSVYFVLRPDGSGCFSTTAGFIDCGQKSTSKIFAGRPWLVSCSLENGERVCTGTDSSAAKISNHQTQGWTIGIGHNNYPGSPIRLRKSNNTNTEYNTNDGWLKRAQFAMVYQHLVSSPEPYVEYVEEVSVEHGPKWTPSSTSKLTLRAVYQYLEWIVKKGAFISQSAAPAAEKASGIPQEYGILNCYMLRLGSTFDEAVQVLGAPTSVKNEFVNSAGIWGATVTWQNKEAICDARFQPDLKLYRISDLTRFEEELKDIMRKRSLTNK